MIDRNKEVILFFGGLLLFFNELFAFNVKLVNFFDLTNENSTYKFINSENDWLIFKELHAFKKVYIVFAGPYPSSPSSSFGHLFLLLEPISNQKRSLLLWDAVNFSAEVNNISSFEKFYKGIFGGLYGTYKIIPFYEKLREYTFIESRPLWVFPFEINPIESDSLLRKIFEFKKLKFKYRFHDKNCASELEYLLRTVITENPSFNRIITSPRDVLISLDNRTKKPMYIESVENVLNKRLNNVSPNFEFNQKRSYISNIEDSEAVVLLNILEWKYFHRNKLLNVDEKQQLENLRLTVSKFKNSDKIQLEEFNKDFYIHPPIKIGGGISISSNIDIEYSIMFRFGLHEFYESYNVFPKYDFLRIGKVNIGIQKKRIIVNELWLFNQLSIPPITSVSNYLSWRLALGAEKKFEFKKETMAMGLFNGIGITLPVLKDALNLTFFANLNTIYLDDFGFTILMGPEFITTFKFTNSFKWIGMYGTTLNIFGGSILNYFVKNRVSLKLFKEIHLILQSKYSQYSHSIGFQITKYLN